VQCAKCKKKFNELWSYTGYGGELYKKYADKWYYKKHFLELEKKIKKEKDSLEKSKKSIKPLW